MLRQKPPTVSFFIDRAHATTAGWMAIIYRANFSKGEKLADGRYATPRRIQFHTGYQTT